MVICLYGILQGRKRAKEKSATNPPKVTQPKSNGFRGGEVTGGEGWG
jgi:hypothetical protein